MGLVSFRGAVDQDVEVMAQLLHHVEAHAGHDVARDFGGVDVLPVGAAEADLRMTERSLDVDAERKHQRPVLDAHVVEHPAVEVVEPGHAQLVSVQIQVERMQHHHVVEHRCPDIQIGDMQRVATVYHHQMRDVPYLAVLVQVQVVGLYVYSGTQGRRHHVHGGKQSRRKPGAYIERAGQILYLRNFLRQRRERGVKPRQFKVVHTERDIGRDILNIMCVVTCIAGNVHEPGGCREGWQLDLAAGGADIRRNAGCGHIETLHYVHCGTDVGHDVARYHEGDGIVAGNGCVFQKFCKRSRSVLHFVPPYVCGGNLVELQGIDVGAK